MVVFVSDIGKQGVGRLDKVTVLRCVEAGQVPLAGRSDMAEMACSVRFRPMMLTAAAVVVGASVILFDPIFQGLEIALMAGEIASLALSRMTVPVVYFIINRRKAEA